MIESFLQALHTQRWDDHRYYHHSRINQTLHFVSATSFLCAYVMLFFYPVAAALIGWLIAMTTRQTGHFFFEPKGYDHVNEVTHEYKEQIKVGYNLRRKIVLLAVWALSMSPKASITSAPASAVARPVSMPSAPACRSHALASQLTALPCVRRP